MQSRKAAILVIAVVILGAVATSAQQDHVAAEVDAVRKHILEREQLERFGSQTHRTKIEDAVATDLDQDGNREVVVLLAPHYRQSAPIIIYRLSKELQVTRVGEGLAPGPLVPLSGAYIDSRTLGQAVDFTIDGAPIDREQSVARLMASRFGGVVEYKTFIHTDSRTGEPAYLDMRHVDVPKGRKDCTPFEFSRVDGIATGVLENEPTTIYLAARVGQVLWLYHVAEFLPNGLMRKEVRSQRLPGDFSRFAPGDGKRLLYLTTAGDVRPLRR